MIWVVVFVDTNKAGIYIIPRMSVRLTGCGDTAKSGRTINPLVIGFPQPESAETDHARHPVGQQIRRHFDSNRNAPARTAGAHQAES